MKATLVKSWGPHEPGTVITTEPPEPKEIQVNQNRFDMLLAGKYFAPAPASITKTEPEEESHGARG